MKWGIVFASTTLPRARSRDRDGTGRRGRRVRVAVVPRARGRRGRRGRHAVQRLARRQDGPPVEAGRHPRPADLARVRGVADVDDPARHERRHRARAPAGRARQVGRHARRAVGRPGPARRRRRRAARGVRRRRHGVHRPRQADGRVPRGDAAALGGGGRHVPRRARAVRRRCAAIRAPCAARCRSTSAAPPRPRCGVPPAFGDGYFPWIAAAARLPATLRQIIADVRAECERIGRDPDEIEYTVGGARTAEEAAGMAELGVDRCTIAIRSKDLAEMRDELARFGDEVIAPTRRTCELLMGVLDGQVAIVTGGGQGVGRGVALAVAKEGARVAVLGRTVVEVRGGGRPRSQAFGGTAIADRVRRRAPRPDRGRGRSRGRRVGPDRPAGEQRPVDDLRVDPQAHRRADGHDVGLGPDGGVPVHAGVLPPPARRRRAA